MDILQKKQIFDYFTENNFNDFFEFIKNNDINLNIYDTNNVYIIQYLVNYNQYEIIKYIFENKSIRIDIFDNDGRSLLYNPIKYNLMNLFELIIDYNKKNIGVNLIDIRDNLGFTALHYCVIFNNFSIFRKLYNYNADIYIYDNDMNNIFDICFKYNRNDFILYLIDNENKKNNYKFTNIRNESVFYSALTVDNNIITDYLIKNEKYIKNIMNLQENEFGLTILHQMVITNNNKYIDKLFEYNINYNIPDAYGNYSYHYAIMEKNIIFLDKLFNLPNYTINYNNTNVNGETILHLLLQYYDYSDITQNDKLFKIFIILLKNTNLNIQNNNGITILHLIIDNKLYENDEIKNILMSGEKELNLFIMDNDNVDGMDRSNDIIINIVINSYYNRLKLIKDISKLTEWEQYCSNDDLNNLVKIIKKRNIDKDISYYCKDIIKNTIINEKRSIPDFKEINLNFEDEIVMENSCFYTGATIDILFGLVYLKKYKNVSFIVSYPLSDNFKLIEYYKKMGIDYSYKLEFNNIEITWSYQKIIYMTNFDSLLLNLITLEDRFIVIPLGIEIAEGSHANIIIIDKVNKIIERFEPNGANQPRNFNYNQSLLDSLLETKFESLLNNYKYIKPKDYLPIVGFQMLETSMIDKCKHIGDPNGFCAVWCIWYTSYRIKNPDVPNNILVLELINNIKLSNKNFRNVIRNFSNKIINLRDDLLKKYNLTINDWMNNNFTQNVIDKIENEVLDLL